MADHKSQQDSRASQSSRPRIRFSREERIQTKTDEAKSRGERFELAEHALCRKLISGDVVKSIESIIASGPKLTERSTSYSISRFRSSGAWRGLLIRQQHRNARCSRFA